MLSLYVGELYLWLGRLVLCAVFVEMSFLSSGTRWRGGLGGFSFFVVKNVVASDSGGVSLFLCRIMVASDSGGVRSFSAE